MTTSPSLPQKSRGWLIGSGILSIILGLAAMAFPFLFSIVLTQVIGVFILLSGLSALISSISGRQTHHRLALGFSGALRILAGLALFIFAYSGTAVLTLILAIVFVVEGLAFLANGWKSPASGPKTFLILNGIITLVLGLMIAAQWPNDSREILGLLYGINSLFFGFSLFSMASAVPKS